MCLRIPLYTILEVPQAKWLLRTVWLLYIAIANSRLILMCSICAGRVVPLLNKVLEELGHSKLTNKTEALNSLYKFLCEKSPEFVEACSIAVKENVQRALKFLQTTLYEIVDICKSNEMLLTQLSKLSVNVGGRAGAIVVGTWCTAKLGAKRATSMTAKRLLKFANPAGMVADVAQAGLEYTGHEEVGKKVGMWGNIGAGAMGGTAIGGPVGAPIGALAGFGIWLIGEAVGRAVEDVLS